MKWGFKMLFRVSSTDALNGYPVVHQLRLPASPHSVDMRFCKKMEHHASVVALQMMH
jgi:hypothetical protein